MAPKSKAWPADVPQTDEADLVVRAARIALTEHQIAFVLSKEPEYIIEKYSGLIAKHLPHDYLKRRFMRLARACPETAMHYRRVWHKTYGQIPEARVKASVSAQMRSRYHRKIDHYPNQPWRFLPFEPADLVEHLEDQFDDQMSWENYGTWWEIDHKTPASFFNIKAFGDAEFMRCWRLANLQPLNKRENRRKGNRWSDA